jgi:hypothetical protein
VHDTKRLSLQSTVIRSPPLSSSGGGVYRTRNSLNANERVTMTLPRSEVKL